MFPAARSYALTLFAILVLPLAGDLETQLANGDFEGAEETLEELSSRWEETATSPEDQIEWARVLMALGTIERKLVKSSEAEAHLRTSLAIFERHSPEETTETREALALTLQDQGKQQEAEELLRENLEAGNLRTMDHLGLLLLQQARYAEAGGLFQSALEATPDNAPVEHARRHQNLGRYWHTLGSHARALGHFEKALEHLESTADVADLKLALTSQRALAQLRLHEIDSARSGFVEAASMARRIHQNQPIAALPHLENLGILALATDDAEVARDRFQEALELLSEAELMEHPAAATTLNNLGIAEMRLKDYPKAREALQRARDLQVEHLPEIHLRVAETERNLATVSLLAGDPQARALVESANRIGLALLEQLVKNGTETERLNFLERVDLVSLSCLLGKPELIANLLLASKSRLLEQLIRPTRAGSSPTWQDVQVALKEDTVFIDFCRYSPPEESPQYGAILIQPEGTPEWFPLGSEPELKGWLEALRSRLAWKVGTMSGNASKPPAFLMAGILRELHEFVLGPMDGAIPAHASRWLISPDGLIHDVPFAALRDEHGRFLCDSLAMTTRVGSGRDILRSPPSSQFHKGPWTLAGVSEFPHNPTEQSDHLASILAQPPPLPGTKKELRSIAAIAPTESTRLMNLSESDLFNLDPSSTVLHLSTHSFFVGIEDASNPPLDLDQSVDRLFASGILLHRAGLRPANTPLPSPDDDILFPSEIAKLPLAGTRLVTLSSCESGTGTSIHGEGQIGLQRAFALAGVRETVSALWPVTDQGSAEFMRRFYEMVLATNNPAQALWQTQREQLETSDDLDAAVLFNAPFILTQQGPALELGEIPDKPKKRFWSWLIPLPLLLFLISRWMPARKESADTA